MIKTLNALRNALIFILALVGFNAELAYGQAYFPPHIDDFFGGEAANSVALSPDGHVIAYAESGEDKNTLQIINLRYPNSPSEITLDHFVRSASTSHIRRINWIDETRLFIEIVSIESLSTRNIFGSDRKRVARFEAPISRAFVLNLDTSDIIEVFPNLNMKSLFAVKGLALASPVTVDPNVIIVKAIYDSSVALWSVNLETGDIDEIEDVRIDVSDYIVTEEGQPLIRFVTHKRKRTTTIYSRRDAASAWKKLRTITDTNTEDFNPLAPADQPDTIFISARPEGYDRSAIFKYNIRSDEFSAPLGQHAHVDVFNALISKDNEYLGMAYFEDGLAYEFTDAELKAQYAQLKQKFPRGQNVFVTQASSDSGVWIVKSEGSQDPGTYHIYNAKTNSLKTLFVNQPQLSRRLLGESHVIKYSARDGLGLSGYLTLPPRAAAKSSPAPLIVMPHGGPVMRDYFEYDLTAQYLSTRGYAVFQPNFRGSSGYGKAFEARGYGQWGGAMIDDIIDGVDHLIETGQADKDKICIAGASYGGYAALISAVRYPDRYQCALSLNGVFHLGDMLDYDAKFFGKNSNVYKFLVTSIGHPKRDKDQLLEISPREQVAQISIPILLVHGTEDERVPVTQSRNMHDALLEAGKDAQYFELPMGDHNLTYTPPGANFNGKKKKRKKGEESGELDFWDFLAAKEADPFMLRKQYMARMAEFFDAHLKP